MSRVVIRGVDLGKRYLIGERERYLALRDLMANALKAPARLFGPAKHSGNRRRHIWALKNVSFEIREGEVVGIVGRNGAGKTTLLKILARVTKPTEGYAEVSGRMGSLLEVGTGFHPELTGGENVSLSGAILGMTKKEIARKFDEIVAFAGVERFIDTPLKHYSAGMQIRLAFAVAAHLESEILLVDEVLAVGDLAFQKKCLGKMSDVVRTGRTILFVSHQMNQIRRLCDRVIWIDRGQIQQAGPTEPVISAYEESMAFPSEGGAVERSGGEEVAFMGWEVVEPRGLQANAVLTGLRPASFRIGIRTLKPIRHGHVAARIYDGNGYLLSGWSFNNLELEAGAHDLVLRFSALPLRPGAYSFFVQVFDDDYRNYPWTLTPPLIIEGAPVTHFMDEWSGALNISCSLQCEQVD
jgi:lipopolysaccharide transport system ATP-binding protein